MATKTGCVSPVGPADSAFRLDIMMPIEATRPQPSANNNRAIDLGRIGLLDGLATHDRTGLHFGV